MSSVKHALFAPGQAVAHDESAQQPALQVAADGTSPKRTRPSTRPVLVLEGTLSTTCARRDASSYVANDTPTGCAPRRALNSEGDEPRGAFFT